MSERWHWLGLAALVTIPLGVLVGYALLGLKAQRRAIMADAHERGRAGVEIVVRELDSAIQQALEAAPPIRLYLSPPLPVEPNAVQQFSSASEAKDLDTLRGIRDSPNTNASAAGLPLQVLAAWQVLDQEPTDDNADTLAQIALHAWPSVMSPLVLEKAASLTDPQPSWTTTWQDDWRQLEEARMVLRKLGDQIPHEAGRFTLADGSHLQAIGQSSAEGIRLILRPELETILSDLPSMFNVGRSMFDVHPPWMAMVVECNGNALGDASAGLTLAAHRGQLDVRSVLASPELMFASYRQQRKLTLGMIASSSLAAALGVWLTHRALMRERRLNALKSQFVASVSHELRAPVASMRLMAEALDAETVTGDKAKAFHHLMAGEGGRLAALIENVPDFARIEEGRKSYTFAETDIEPLVTDAVSLLKPQAEARQQGLVIDMRPLTSAPSIDGPAVQQALINLIDNAIKFSPQKTDIHVRLAPDESSSAHWLLEVEDHGPGIASKEQERIFERFTRLENELRRETRGAGIGLSLVKHIVEAHGGAIQINSVLGKGEAFRMRLPIQQHG